MKKKLRWRVPLDGVRDPVVGSIADHRSNDRYLKHLPAMLVDSLNVGGKQRVFT